jgi:NH(3)-dependent NAD(+) synthetase (EC 6.3.1.5)
MFDFYRAAACVPELRVGDVEFNKQQILDKLVEAASYDVGIIAFPELAVTGYTCQDLFFQKTLLDASNKAVGEIAKATESSSQAVILGAPVVINNRLYNGAYVIVNGTVIGITVKTMLPNYNEFYEKRWFTSAAELDTDYVYIPAIGDYSIPVGSSVVYELGGVNVGIEICEDAWGPVTPGSWMTLAGAEIIVNISASNEVIGKREYRRELIKHLSSANICEYIYVSAGCDESTQDVIFSGQSMIAEYGRILNENKDYIASDYILIADMDLGRIRADRMRNTTFGDARKIYRKNLKDIMFVSLSDISLPESDGEYIITRKHPFIPSSKTKRVKRCNDIFDMQVGGLAKRLSFTGSKPVVGVSGGMDSTLALLVSAKALKKLGRPASDLVAITMPAFGTTDRTYNNSLELIKSLGAEPIIINIKDSCLQHFKDIGHDPEEKDTTYENTQARERTQVLMDYANKCRGLVVGTGDLSELALGWCTYNGDQMSMYGVNGSIPKTLVRWMIDSVVENNIFPGSEAVLKDILDTPISPELLPPDEKGEIAQKTEDAVGPYELHDFFLYYTLRFGYSPSKVYFLVKKAFNGDYTDAEIKKWMNMFYRRFFAQQFKRSCMPDGVKVGTISMSPRGDLRMPSDASPDLWMKELESL